jgi:hypothetical protein
MNIAEENNMLKEVRFVTGEQTALSLGQYLAVVSAMKHTIQSFFLTQDRRNQVFQLNVAKIPLKMSHSFFLNPNSRNINTPLNKFDMKQLQIS